MKITIINSEGHWKNGWVSSKSDLQSLSDSLERNGYIVDTVEVNSINSLEQALQHISKDTLILPNAYYVNKYKGSEETIWMVDVIESYGLPFIGSNGSTLKILLQKDICQSTLQKYNLPIPKFVAISQEQLNSAKGILASSNLTYPLIIKLTAESGSMGMDENSLVNTEEEAIIQIKKMIQSYNSDVIIEEFLPSDDITVGYLQNSEGEPTLLTTWYLVEDKPGTHCIMGQKERFMPWGGVKQMKEVKDEAILKQVKAIIPKVCEALNICDITRIDGRLDKNGQFKIFDVNGFPALSFPESVGVKQIMTYYPDYEKLALFDILINTIVLNAAKRYNLNVPKQASFHNFLVIQ